MILDHLKNFRIYQALPPRWLRALEFLQSTNLDELPLGRHPLDGDRLFALVQEYTTKPVEQCRWEAHRRYCDVQFVARGVERIGYANLAAMQVETPHDAEKDVAFFTGDGDLLTVRAGMFAVFTPADVHLPCLAADEPTLVRKVVVKAEL